MCVLVCVCAYVNVYVCVYVCLRVCVYVVRVVLVCCDRSLSSCVHVLN